MEFLLIFGGPGSFYSARLVWENGCGNDCEQLFYEFEDLGIIRAAFAFIRNKGFNISAVSLNRSIERSMAIHVS